VKLGWGVGVGCLVVFVGWGLGVGVVVGWGLGLGGCWVIWIVEWCLIGVVVRVGLRYGECYWWCFVGGLCCCVGGFGDSCMVDWGDVVGVVFVGGFFGGRSEW